MTESEKINFCAWWLRDQGDIYQSNGLADDVKHGERLHICADEIDRLEAELKKLRESVSEELAPK